MASKAHAQFGVIAGLTSSKVNATEAVKDAKNIVLYHAGLTYKFDLGAGFAIQPSAIYQVKGAKISSIGETTGDQLKTGYVEIPLSIQWGPDLMAFRPYAFAEPFIGYQVYGSDDYNIFTYGMDMEPFRSYLRDAKNKFEGGFGVGGGLELMNHFQISVQWFKNIGQLYSGDKLNASAIEAASTSDLKDVKNYSGVKITLGMFF
jgi:hypothetical protein